MIRVRLRGGAVMDTIVGQAQRRASEKLPNKGDT